MGDIHRAVLNGRKGYYDSRTGEVKFGRCVYSSIAVAVKYLSAK